jgi:hypothetical protein
MSVWLASVSFSLRNQARPRALAQGLDASDSSVILETIPLRPVLGRLENSHAFPPIPS